MPDQSLREHVIYMLSGGGAHLDFEAAIANLPEEFHAAKVDRVPHSPWRILEHMRICQWDILEFSRNAAHVSPDFPTGYWPDGDAPPNDLAWQKSVQSFRDDLNAMIELVSNPGTDLFARIPHDDGQTILREALLLADHNAYHLGQLVLLRRVLGVWGD